MVVKDFDAVVAVATGAAQSYAQWEALGGLKMWQVEQSTLSPLSRAFVGSVGRLRYCSGTFPKSSKISARGMIPGSLQVVKKKKTTESSSKITEKLGKMKDSFSHSAGTARAKYARLQPKMQPHISSVYFRSRRGPVMQRPKQKNRFIPGQMLYSRLLPVGADSSDWGFGSDRNSSGGSGPTLLRDGSCTHLLATPSTDSLLSDISVACFNRVQLYSSCLSVSIRIILRYLGPNLP